MCKARQTIFSAAVFGILGSSLLLADTSKISPELLKANGSGKVQVIVQYKTAPPSALALASNPLLGAVLTKTFTSLNAVIMSLPLASLGILSEVPEVLYISSDRPLTQLLDYSVAAVRGDVARSSNLNGAGVAVAVIDSGIADSPDLSLLNSNQILAGNVLGGVSRVAYRESFITSTSFITSSAKDAFGHGTHVAGIIAGNGASSTCFNCTRSLAGLAPNATLVDLQVLNAKGQGSDSAVISAIDRAIQLRKTLNIRVINLSLGRPVYESYTKDPLCKAVEAAWKAGITVVVAAGNSGRDNSAGNQGYGTIQSPANDPYVITVGAMKAMGTLTRTDDLIASYSSKGPSAIDFVVKPDLVAPGNHVVSLEAPNSLLASDPTTAVPVSYYQSTTNSTASGNFILLNGTSMATPVVSGSIADLLQAQPQLTPDQIKARLMTTAYKAFPISSTAVDPVTGQTFTSNYDMFTIGAGYLDVGAALASHDVATGTALSPTASYDPASGKVFLNFGSGSTWGGSGASSTSAVWGTNVGPGNSVWGSSAVWGSSGVGGFRAIWGTKGVWAAGTDFGTSSVDGTKGVWGASSQTSDSDNMFSAQQ